MRGQPRPRIKESPVSKRYPQAAFAGCEVPWDEMDCAPHPFDIMAIYAIYQGVD